MGLLFSLTILLRPPCNIPSRDERLLTGYLTLAPEDIGERENIGILLNEKRALDVCRVAFQDVLVVSFMCFRNITRFMILTPEAAATAT